MPAHHVRRHPLVVANARHSPSYGCALRLDQPPSGALLGHDLEVYEADAAAAEIRPEGAGAAAGKVDAATGPGGRSAIVDGAKHLAAAGGDLDDGAGYNRLVGRQRLGRVLLSGLLAIEALERPSEVVGVVFRLRALARGRAGSRPRCCASTMRTSRPSPFTRRSRRS